MTEDQGTIDLALQSITQPTNRYTRNLSVTPSQEAHVGQNVGFDDENPTVFTSQLTVSVESDVDDSPAFEFYDEVRVEFTVRPEHADRLTGGEEIEGAIDYVRNLADPYHRYSLVAAMNKAGLPLLTLPLPQAEGWRTNEQRATES